jgi:hypothetical protein
MKKILFTLIAVCVINTTSVCFAEGIHDIQDAVGEDKICHAAVSYIICDQLKRVGMNDFWAAITTLAIGAAKEKFIDNNWDSGDFAADCAGVALYQVKF